MEAQLLKRVVSFKVTEETYNILRSKYPNFTTLFEPIADEIAKNNSNRNKYTRGIHKNNDDLYISLGIIKKTIDKIIKSYCSTKKR